MQSGSREDENSDGIHQNLPEQWQRTQRGKPMIKTIDELLDKLRSKEKEISTLQMWRNQFKTASEQLRQGETLNDEEFRNALDRRDVGYYTLMGSVKTLQIVGVISWKEELEIQRNLLEEFTNHETT